MILEAAAPRRRPAIRLFVNHPSAQLTIGSASVLSFVIIWQIAGSLHWGVADQISTPLKVAQEFFVMLRSGELSKNLSVSLWEFVEGFVPAVAAGLAFGIAYSVIPRVRYLTEPLFVCLYTAPLIAFIPIIVLWFGVGIQSKAVMVFVSAFIPVALNTSLGVEEVQESWIRACRAFGATPLQVVRKAVIPGALPGIMSGIRLAVGRGIVGLVAAEMYASMLGIGRLIQTYGSNADTTAMLVLVAIISGIGFTAVTVLRAVERQMLPWRYDT